MLNRLGVSKARSFFDHNGKKIFVFADMPHVIKSISNCLLTNTIKFSNGTANWQHIQDFYTSDKQQKLRYVAAALATYANLGALHMNANETAEFCQQVNDFLNVLNSCKKLGKTKYQNP
ncbi:unnamed protein product [Lepeophtheirus salmonis]|uniref:(salmon louse) hypothetical protein n=1 Tax=Lepeophtheirus salmonis TaxID=72036 RepID=A0A7R8GZL0_LEPSM|nr:unnamed protein product [Lepeophtheirus salmonis]CAF2768059.1 unnamed protein product [Lepeophtheirus salmonis]